MTEKSVSLIKTVTKLILTLTRELPIRAEYWFYKDNTPGFTYTGVITDSKSPFQPVVLLCVLRLRPGLNKVTL